MDSPSVRLDVLVACRLYGQAERGLPDRQPDSELIASVPSPELAPELIRASLQRLLRADLARREGGVWRGTAALESWLERVAGPVAPLAAPKRAPSRMRRGATSSRPAPQRRRNWWGAEILRIATGLDPETWSAATQGEEDPIAFALLMRVTGLRIEELDAWLASSEAPAAPAPATGRFAWFSARPEAPSSCRLWAAQVLGVSLEEPAPPRSRARSSASARSGPTGEEPIARGLRREFVAHGPLPLGFRHERLGSEGPASPTAAPRWLVGPLEAFAGQVQHAAARIQAPGRFTTHLVYLVDLRRALGLVTEEHWRLLDARLIEAHAARMLTLQRADLVEGMDPDRLASSRLPHMRTAYHLLRIENS